MLVHAGCITISRHLTLYAVNISLPSMPSLSFSCFFCFCFRVAFAFVLRGSLAIYLQPKCQLNLNLFTPISLTPHRTKQHDNNSRNSTNMDVSADLAAHAARLSVNTGGRPSHSESSFVVP